MSQGAQTFMTTDPALLLMHGTVVINWLARRLAEQILWVGEARRCSGRNGNKKQTIVDMELDGDKRASVCSDDVREISGNWKTGNWRCWHAEECASDRVRRSIN